MVDPNLGGDYDKDEFVILVDLSLKCVRKCSSDRPFMREVVQKLREIKLESVAIFCKMDSVHPEVDTGIEVSSGKLSSSNNISEFVK